MQGSSFSLKERLVYKINDKDILGFTGEELKEFEEFVKGKTIKEVEWWVMEMKSWLPLLSFLMVRPLKCISSAAD